jgi:predicted Zn-dependent protease|tara:strand:- start:76 stop:924 length:849 start_codon:yes stop_codon:yes gene_type:complete
MNEINNINRRKFLEIFGACSCALMIASCSTAPITERKQLRLIPESTLNNQAAQIYEKVKQKTKLSDDKKKLDEIEEIGSRIEEAVSAYFASINKNDPTYNFQWEYILVDNDKIKNAWCMPGGKIAVYTGILPITKNKHGLAAVMGHEIAHAVAKHSIERASRALVLNIGTVAADIFSGGAISRTSRATGVDVAGMLRTFGIDNPFGRKQETEADYLGLIFSSLAGYDIRESVKVWERMREAYKGQEPPEWMSTHPSSERRIETLKNWIPEIIIKYPPIKKIS